MQYKTNEQGQLVAIFSDGQQIVRGKELDWDYLVYYDYIYFVDNKLIVSPIQGKCMELLYELIKMKAATEKSKIYAAVFW